MTEKQAAEQELAKEEAILAEIQKKMSQLSTSSLLDLQIAVTRLVNRRTYNDENDPR